MEGYCQSEHLATIDLDSLFASAVDALEEDVFEWHIEIKSKTDEVPDSAYAMFSALCKQSPSLHVEDWQGIYLDNKIIMRAPLGILRSLQLVKDALLRVGGGGVLLGDVSLRRLEPASTLKANHVVLCDRGYPSNTAWMIAWGMSLQRRLDDLGVECTVSVDKSDGITISRHHMRTFSVVLSSLSDADSLIVQQNGIGSKRKLGCGVFV